MKSIIYYWGLLYGIVLIFLEINLYGQEIINYNPPTIEAASLGKFGNLKSNPNSGAVEANVPIYEIDIRNLKIPITLDYVSGTGVKVDERATWVGLGWKLNAGAAIYRKIVDKDDLGSNGFKTTVVPTGSGITNYYKYDALFQKFDTEPDEFSFFGPTMKGKFIFKNNGGPLLLEKSGSKVNYNAGNFEIIDENGITYLFQDKETVSTVINTAPPWVTPGGTGSSYYQSWWVTKIISADKTDTVYFNYNKTAPTIYENSYRFFQIHSTGWNPPGGSYWSLDPIEKTHMFSSYDPMYLESIIFPGGKVQFTSVKDRKDGAGLRLEKIEILSGKGTAYSTVKQVDFYSTYFQSLANPFPYDSEDGRFRLRLDSVGERGPNSLSSNVHRFEYSKIPLPSINSFAQDAWGYYNGHTENRTLLASLRKVSISGIVNIGNADRGVDANFIEAGLLKKVIYPTGGSSEFFYEPNRFRSIERKLVRNSFSCIANAFNPILTYEFVAGNYVDPTISIEIRKIGDQTGLYNRPYVLLKDLTENTNVYSAYAEAFQDQNFEVPFFFKEGHRYQIYAEMQSTNPATSAYAGISVHHSSYVEGDNILPGFGVRVAAIDEFNKENQRIGKKVFKYGTNENGTGIVISDVINSFPKQIEQDLLDMQPSNGATCAIARSKHQIVYYDAGIYPLSTFNGSPLLYNQTSVYQMDAGMNTMATNGKEEFMYKVVLDHTMPGNTGYPGGILTVPNAWVNSKLLSNAKYEERNGRYFLKHKVDNDYVDIFGEEGRGLKLGYRIQILNCNARSNDDWYYSQEYSVVTGARMMSNQKEVFYDSTGNNVLSEVNTKFSYNDKMQLVSSKNTTSRGDTVEIQNQYTYDLVKAGTSDPVVKTMLDRNMLNFPFSKRELRNGKLISSRRAQYKAYGLNLFANYLIEQQDLKNNLWYPVVKYDNYLKINTPTTILSLNGISTVCLWGYAGQYLIAEIKNANYEEVKTILGQQTIDMLKTQNVPEATIITAMNKLRTDLPKAMVTSYTYKPLVGMTSKTDPRGEKETYKYDGMQRLQAVLDDVENVTKAIDYHYRPN